MKGHGLLCVKSIMTILITGGLVAAFLLHPDDTQVKDTFLNAVMVIITFYFSHQLGKSTAQDETKTASRENEYNEGSEEDEGTGRK